MKAIRTLALATFATSAIALASTAMLSPVIAASYAPGCTTKPSSTWMSMDDAAATVTKAGYMIAKSKVSGTCYEFYVRKNGAKTELFLDPTDAHLVHNTQGI